MDPLETEFLFEVLDLRDRVFVARAAESQGERPQGELEEPPASLARHVVLALRRGLGDEFNLPFVQPQTDVELLEDFIPSVDVRQEDFRGRALSNDIKDAAAAGVRERLRGHNNGAV